MMKKNYRTTPGERIRVTRTLQPREETLSGAFNRTIKSRVKLRRLFLIIQELRELK